MSEALEPLFFENPAAFRAWLEANHETAPELILAFRRRSTGLPTITWREAVDVALCFGWIDGVRRSLDETAYTNRFTPRRARSIWSAVNIKRVAELEAAGLMTAAGRRAFDARRADRMTVYSHEQAVPPRLDEAFTERFRAESAAGLEWFEKQASSYRRQVSHWVMSAKKPETRERRLALLIADSAESRRVGQFRRPTDG